MFVGALPEVLGCSPPDHVWSFRIAQGRNTMAQYYGISMPDSIRRGGGGQPYENMTISGSDRRHRGIGVTRCKGQVISAGTQVKPSLTLWPFGPVDIQSDSGRPDRYILDLNMKVAVTVNYMVLHTS